MWIIVTYDVNAKRNARVLKICRKYLYHVQKSVFEGHISDKKLYKMKMELARVIVPENDQIAIYMFDTLRYAKKEMIGYHLSIDNII